MIMVSKYDIIVLNRYLISMYDIIVLVTNSHQGQMLYGHATRHTALLTSMRSTRSDAVWPRQSLVMFQLPIQSLDQHHHNFISGVRELS